MNRALPGSLYTHLFPRSPALSTHPKRGGMGGYPPSLGAFLEGGSQSVRPLLTHHKKASLLQSTQTQIVFMRSFLAWCGLLLLIGAFCVRGNWSEPSSVPPVAACWSIKPVCTPPWPSLRPVRPPRVLTVDKCWVWPIFDACVGVCRVSGVHGLNVPSPLCPPHAHSYHGVYLQSMDPPPPPSSAGPPDDDPVSGTHRLNVSRAPDTPCSFFLCSFHLGATTTTTTTTIVTTPRRQATAGKCLFRSR